jgi:hypothetical protein
MITTVEAGRSAVGSGIDIHALGWRLARMLARAARLRDNAAPE